MLHVLIFQNLFYEVKKNENRHHCFLNLNIKKQYLLCLDIIFIISEEQYFEIIRYLKILKFYSR